MTLQIVGQTIEAGEPVYLVSINGSHPEPMSEKALRESVELPQGLIWHLNADTGVYEPRIITYARPDQIDRRGGPICACCGGPTRSVLDGEAWCDKCQRYQ